MTITDGVDFPGDRYNNYAYCSFKLQNNEYTRNGVLFVDDFNTETKYDHLFIKGTGADFSGRIDESGIQMLNGKSGEDYLGKEWIWTSDLTERAWGWKICIVDSLSDAGAVTLPR